MTSSVEPIAAVKLRNCLAPAKLNLFLHVLGQRDDGYHELETVFELIDLYDRLHFSVRSDGAIMRRGGIHGLAHDNDLSVRAARLLAAASETRHGVDIEIEKHIPMGGGLGGGSSNAATTLLALNRLWNVHWPVARLARLAAQLGADVPVFVHGNAALAGGVGEKLTPLSLPQQIYVVVAPPATVPTAEIFGAPELTRDSKPLKILPLSSLTVEAIGKIGRNDMEAAAFARYPAVQQALLELNKAAEAVFKAAAAKEAKEARAAAAARAAAKKAAAKRAQAESQGNEQDQADDAAAEDELAEKPGARWSAGRMSGSGGCVFIPVPTREQAEAIAERVNKTDVGEALVVSSIKGHPMRSWAFGRGLPRKSLKAVNQDSDAGSGN